MSDRSHPTVIPRCAVARRPDSADGRNDTPLSVKTWRMSASSLTASDWSSSASSAASTNALHAARAVCRPVTAGGVGDRDQRLPGVGGAVLDRHVRFGRRSAPRCAVAAQSASRSRRASRIGPSRRDRNCDTFSPRARRRMRDVDGAVGDGVGHGADPRERGHRETSRTRWGSGCGPTHRSAGRPR